MAKRRKKQGIASRDAVTALVLCWMVGLFCCLFLSRIMSPVRLFQGIPGRRAYHSSTRLYSGKHSNTFSGLRLDFPGEEPLFLEQGMTPELARQVEALAPGTELRYLQEPDSGCLMTLETEAETLLSYEAYEADGQRGAAEVTWFGRVFLLLGAVFLIPLGQNLRSSRKYPKKKKNQLPK